MSDEETEEVTTVESGSPVGCSFRICGGLSAVKEPDDEVQEVVNKVHDQIKANSPDKEVPHIKVINYKKQVVAGLNYFVKADIGENDIVHLRVYKHFVNEPQLDGILHGQSLEAPIDHFEINVHREGQESE